MGLAAEFYPFRSPLQEILAIISREGPKQKSLSRRLKGNKPVRPLVLEIRACRSAASETNEEPGSWV